MLTSAKTYKLLTLVKDLVVAWKDICLATTRETLLIVDYGYSSATKDRQMLLVPCSVNWDFSLTYHDVISCIMNNDVFQRTMVLYLTIIIQ